MSRRTKLLILAFVLAGTFGYPAIAPELGSRSLCAGSDENPDGGYGCSGNGGGCITF